MFNSLINFLFPKKPEVIHPDADYALDIANVPRWPPFDNGLPNIEIQKILQTQASLIKSINDSLNSPIANEAILNFLNYVHLLPATKEHNHCGAGGLFRMGLEIAYHSLRASEGKIFTAAETPDIRQITEPKWRLAAFLSGLCCESYRAMSGMIVTSTDGSKWPSLNMPLTEWLSKNNHQRYYIRWVSNESHNQLQAQTMSAYVANQIIPQSATLAISTEFNEIALALMATINGSGLDHPNPLTSLVQDIRIRVIEKDVNADNRAFGKPIVGMHLEPYIVAAMRKMISTGNWTANQKGSRIWVDKTGTYLIWRTAFQEIYSHLDRDILKGMPNDMHVLSDMMVKSGAFLADTKNNSTYWMIYPPTSDNSFPAVKLSSLDVLFDMETQSAIMPVSKDLLKENPQPQKQPQNQQEAKKESNQKPENKSNKSTTSENEVKNNKPKKEDKNKQENNVIKTENTAIKTDTETNTEADETPPFDPQYDSQYSDSELEDMNNDANQSYSQDYEAPTVVENKELLPSVRKSLEITPKQRTYLQRLDKNSSAFMEKVMLSIIANDPNKPKIGFHYSHGKYTNLYAIPLASVDESNIDRVTFTQQLHANDFAWVEPGQTRRVQQINNPQTSKTETCIIINPQTCKNLSLIADF